MSIFFVFLIGLFIGSFLNVLIDRLPRNEKITGRSYCESCKKTLTWKDLIPLLSFIYLRGKCRFCKAELSFQYPLLEIITGVMFAFTLFHLPFTNYHLPFTVDQILLTIYSLIIVSSFIVIFFADLKYGIIPDKIIFPSVLVTLVYLFLNLNSLILNHMFSAVGAFLFFLGIFLLTRGKGMGFGDVKLSFLLGLVLGFPGVALALYIAFLTGGFIGIILILWKKKSLKLAVPFGPFLIAGTLISLFFSENIIPRISSLFF